MSQSVVALQTASLRRGEGQTEPPSEPYQDGTVRAPTLPNAQAGTQAPMSIWYPSLRFRGK